MKLKIINQQKFYLIYKVSMIITVFTKSLIAEKFHEAKFYTEYMNEWILNIGDIPVT